MKKLRVTGKAEVHCPNEKVFSKGDELSEEDLKAFTPGTLKSLIDDGYLGEELEPDPNPTGGRAEEKTPEPKTPPGPVGKWNVDPDAVRGKSLEDLNIMVIEKDPSIAPFDTKEEAIAQLSLDYKVPVYEVPV